MPWISDHVVNQEIVFPGAGYIEAALALGYHQLNSRNFAIEDIKFNQVLIYQERQQTRLRTSFDPTSSIFSSHSSVVGHADSWNLHAQGKLIENCVGSPTNSVISQSSIDSGEPMDIDSFYDALAERGLRYGPQFRTVKQLRRLEDDQLFAKLERQTEDDDSLYILHPAMLDGAFQSMLALLPEEDVDGAGSASPFVPVSIERIDFYQQVPGQAIAVCTKLSISETELIANIELQNDMGETLIRMSGIKCQALPTHQLKDALDGIFYEMTWTKMILRRLSLPLLNRG